MSSLIFLTSETEEGELEMRCARFGQISHIKTEGDEIHVTFKHQQSASDARDKLSTSLTIRAPARPPPKPELTAADITWQVPPVPVSAWSDTLSFEAQVEDFEKMQRRDLHNRYLLIKGASDSKDITPLSDEITNVERLNLHNDEVYHVTLKSTRAASALLYSVPSKLPNSTVCFAAPRKSSKKLWFACSAFPVIDASQFRGVLEKFGKLTDFTIMADRGCAFSTFERTSDAVSARNHLYGCVCAPGATLNVDFVPINRPRSPPRRSPRSRSPRSRRSRSRSRRRSPTPDKVISIELKKMGDIVGQVSLKVLAGHFRVAEDFFALKTFQVNVDQRTKIEHCVSSMRRANDPVIMSCSSTSDLVAFCDYFKDKDRIGFYIDNTTCLYLVPVCKQFIEPLSISSRLIGSSTLLAILVSNN